VDNRSKFPAVHVPLRRRRDIRGDVGGDMLSAKKMMPEHNTSQEKSRTETTPTASAEQSTELTVYPKLFVALNWYLCICLHFKCVWVNLMLV